MTFRTTHSSDPSLWQMAKGERSIILGYDSRLSESFKNRLTELGFRAGAVILCTMTPRFGAPKLYKVANSVYSLERQVAELIKTEPVRS